jgi:hypothetical protein
MRTLSSTKALEPEFERRNTQQIRRYQQSEPEQARSNKRCKIENEIKKKMQTHARLKTIDVCASLSRFGVIICFCPYASSISGRRSDRVHVEGRAGHIHVVSCQCMATPHHTPRTACVAFIEQCVQTLCAPVCGWGGKARQPHRQK